MAQRRGHGEGSVYQRGKRWAYLLPRHLVAPGERGYQGGFGSKRDAQDALRAAITAAEQGVYVRKSPDTLRAYAEGVFLPKERAQLRASTYAMYKEKLQTHLLPHLGDVKLQNVTPVALQQVWARLQSGDGDRPALGARSVRMVYSITRKLFAEAESQGLVVRNPAIGSNPPSRKAAEPPAREVWTREQIESFLQYVHDVERIADTDITTRRCRTCEQHLPTGMFALEPRGRDGLKPDCRKCYAESRRESGQRPESPVQLRLDHDPLYPLLVLAARTGMRRGELCGLKWCDVDLDAGLMQLRRQYALQGDKWGFADLKTERSRRVVPIDPDTVATLRQHRAAQAKRRMALGALYDADLDMVFAMADGQPLRPPQVTRRFSKLAKDAGLPAIKLHGLRHSVGTIASESDLAGASMLLGHHDPAFTASQYVHPDVDRIRRAQGAVGA